MTSADVGSQASGKLECRDAGVTIAFKVGSAELDQNARGALDGVATWMKADPKRTMSLEGFADTTGDSDANLVLSAHRADAVKAYLVEQGVPAPNVRTLGRGEETDHLPANGRAVTFLACRPGEGAPAVAEARRAGTAAPGGAPAPVSAPVTVVPPPAAPVPSYRGASASR